MHHYRAFDLDIASDVPLPELAAAPGLAARGHLAIRRADLPSGGSGPLVPITFGPEMVDLRWPAVGAFRVRGDGGMIEASAAEGVGDDLLAFPLLGPVLAMALHLRGLFTLHASAVALPSGVGVALLGDKGAGKSTTAAALVAGGSRLLSDDIVAVDDPGPTARLRPGFPQVKLEGAAADRFAGGEALRRPSVHEAIPKTRILMADAFDGRAVPLGRLYLLERDAAALAPRVVRCAPAEGLAAMLPHAYAARFGPGALAGDRAARHFRAAVALAEAGLVARLVVPAGLDRLAQVGDAVAADLAP